MKSSFGMASSLAGHGSRSAPLALSQMMTAATRLFLLITLCSTLVMAQTLPYVPTSIFLPTTNGSPWTQDNASAAIAYIISPTEDSVELLALNISSSLKASSLSFTTLSADLPFLDGNHTAFSPSLADNGSLIIYAGDCSSATSAEVWTFSIQADDASTQSWTQETASVNTNVDTIQMGPGFLGGSFSFSTTLEPQVSQANTYVYGGMCPDSQSNASSSQSRATYSNQMLKLAPSAPDAGGYTVSPVASKGPPVPEAGFTFTGLSPSISNRSGTVTQQNNYVLLGGHTEWAFINMSTVAIWSLPEESWAFVSNIKIADSSSTNTELAAKSTVDSIDSRSGHTAILNEEGTALIILGGWVGDLTQAASPQLAVLEIGVDYGGAAGTWQWSVPDNQPSGTGIFGHGAALLPGNVMMVYGGYSISEGGNTKRQSGGVGAPTFLNLTSMEWTDSYTNPTTIGENQDDSSDGNKDDTKRRLGLGLGIGLGLLAIIAAIILYFYYRRRLRHKRMIRESAIRALAQDRSRFLPNDEMIENEHGWYMGGPDPYTQGGRSLGYQSLQTGRGSMDNGRQDWFGDIPPLQIPRKPIAPRAARGQYQPTPTGAYDSPPNARGGAGVIHPIMEADEDGSLHDGDIASEPISPIRGDTNRNSGQYSDPFVTPTQERHISFPPPSRGSATPSPEDRRRTTDPEVQDWMSDVDAADALLTSRAASRSAAATGRISPTRRKSGRSNRSLGGYAADDDSRTGSNISESNRSNLNMDRSGSVRSHHHLRPSGFGIGVALGGEERGGSSSSSSAPSYNTARSSFPALQAEGPGLLMGKNRDRDEEEQIVPGSPSKSKPRRSWLGSLRRVFSGPTPSPSPPGSRGDETSPLHEDEMGEASDFDVRLGGLGGLAAADGLLRRKAGRGAWERATPVSSSSFSATAGAGGGGGLTEERDPLRRGDGGGGDDYDDYDDDDDWDIEKAIEKRLVQVMFTVPKERRLRVVNAEPEVEVESGEDVVVVNPETDLLPKGAQAQAATASGSATHHEDVDGERQGLVAEKQQQEQQQQQKKKRDEEEEEEEERETEHDLSVAIPVPPTLPLSVPSNRPGTATPPIATPSPLSENDDKKAGGGKDVDAEKEALRRELEAEWEMLEAEAAVSPPPPPLTTTTTTTTRPEPPAPVTSGAPTPIPIPLATQQPTSPNLTTTQDHPTHHPSDHHLSPTTPSAAPATTTPETKPRNRVLAMVESFESMSHHHGGGGSGSTGSRDSSPRGSPGGGGRRSSPVRSEGGGRGSR
ncbi:hypothetical protein F4778DRAFT_423001 [Xylariomycetidae sp. FL2044]|nr:hypothetical protein F4778DRAFT_423001 [Xylariomycetidae sp. FL2044]